MTHSRRGRPTNETVSLRVELYYANRPQRDRMDIEHDGRHRRPGRMLSTVVTIGFWRYPSGNVKNHAADVVSVCLRHEWTISHSMIIYLTWCTGDTLGTEKIWEDGNGQKFWHILACNDSMEYGKSVLSEVSHASDETVDEKPLMTHYSVTAKTIDRTGVKMLLQQVRQHQSISMTEESWSSNP